MIENIFIGDKTNHFCSKSCRYEYLTIIKAAAGNCTKCGEYVDFRDSTGRCGKCTSIQIKNIDYSKRFYINECLNCKSKFKAKTANTKYCNNCCEEMALILIYQ